MDIFSLITYIIAFISLFATIFFLMVFFSHRQRIGQSVQRTEWEPRISVVIAAYNEEKTIGDCIKSVLASHYPRGKLEVIVVNDGSTDRTSEIAKSFKKQGVMVLDKKNEGKANALNYGIARAKGGLIATMDADSYVKQDTIRKLLPLFESGEVGAVTPAVKVMPRPGFLRQIQRIEYMMILFSRKILSYIESVPVTPGPFSLFRAHIFKEIGGFDPHNLVEDQEIALRLQKHHYKIRSSLEAEVYTETPDTWKGLVSQRVRWQRGGIRNYIKYSFMMTPRYGDFGMFFIPLNFISFIAFFIVLLLMVKAMFFSPYYMKYIWLDTIVPSITAPVIVSALVVLMTFFWIYLSVSAFKEEKVRFRYIIIFLFFYWYLMLVYNVLTVLKEIRKESFSW